MNTRSILRILLLVSVVAAVTLSCTYDYWLDFELGDIGFGIDYVDVDYSMTNAGGRDMENASIHIRVTADLSSGGSEPQDLWVPTEGVDLSAYGGYHSDTATFLFSSEITDAIVEVIGSRWDESGIDY